MAKMQIIRDRLVKHEMDIFGDIKTIVMDGAAICPHCGNEIVITNCSPAYCSCGRVYDTDTGREVYFD
jgi:hypothetical protein